jgi:hypothetical protein
MASIRNCVSASLPWAPIARRIPISRVRSVTDTSMMFMMPMPPTTSDTPAMAASSSVMVFEVWVAGCGDFLLRAHGEVGLATLAALGEEVLDVLFHLVEFLRRAALDQDRADEGAPGYPAHVGRVRN